MKHVNLHIKSTFNNTIISITNSKGDSLFTISSGFLNFKKSKKTAAFGAKICLEKALQKIKTLGVKYVFIYLKGLGYGRNSILKELKKTDLFIVSLKDITPIPHNGCRPKKQRRR